MRVASLALTDFRSYPQLRVDLEPGGNVLVGRNGAGKTNLVEALGYVSGLASHRVAGTAPLVRLGRDRAVIRAEVVRDGRTLLAELEIVPGRGGRARLGGAPLPRPREILGVLRTVLFAPEDLALVKGEPAGRRLYLDELLVARAPRFAGVRADYERVVRQRTALLRTAAAARRSGQLGALDAWDAHLARVGGELLAGRLELVEALRPRVDKAYSEIAAAAGPATMEYTSALGDGLPADRQALAAELAAALAEQRAAELDRGLCLVGPHRDELALGLAGLPARGYASHGESWSLALALRLAGYELLRADGGEPVLLLDDVFAELDAARRDRLADLVAPAEQVVVTAAVSADVPERLAASRFEVVDGQVRRAG